MVEESGNKRQEEEEEEEGTITTRIGENSELFRFFLSFFKFSKFLLKTTNRIRENSVSSGSF